MIIAVPKELHEHETRVAAVPDSVARFVKSGLKVRVQSGAGDQSFFPDEAFITAGAQVVATAQELYSGADIVLKVRGPLAEEMNYLHSGVVLIAFLEILRHPDIAQELARRKVTSFSMDTIPRISRAQSMDALSSQASIAGYKSVLLAANHLLKYFPMLTTAAGTIPPAKVLVLGAGVAGLQAIATAKRLGATVEAFDIRTASKSEVESLGARFIEVELQEDTDAKGGYAREVSQSSQELIKKTIHERVQAMDVVITTAQVPGKKAPLLVPKEMVESMRPGSVIVDLASEQGGNCELSQPGVPVMHHGVLILGPINLPAQVATHASQLYAKNIATLANHLLKDGQLHLDFKDEITQGCCITHGGQIVLESLK